jgi:hypothetical protein
MAKYNSRRFLFELLALEEEITASFEMSGPTHPATWGSHHKSYKRLVPAYIFQKYVLQSSSGTSFLGVFQIIILYPFAMSPKHLILDKPTNSENCSNLLSLPPS